MKVVGAKLDDSDYDRFETFCIDEGLSKSEIIRDLIKKYCDAYEDDMHSDLNDKKPTVRIVSDNSLSEFRHTKIIKT